MKSFASLFMSFVLTAAMLTGCGCTNRNGGPTPPTTMLPTTEMTTTPSTTATENTTVPTVNPSQGTDETINHGNGPLVDDTTAPTEGTSETTEQNRSRQMPIK